MVQYSENQQTGNWAEEPSDPSIQGMIQILQAQIHRTQTELVNHQSDTQNKLNQILLALNYTHLTEKNNTEPQEQDKNPVS
jgi:hypothetical protein